jgi:hypothetical protein
MATSVFAAANAVWAEVDCCAFGTTERNRDNQVLVIGVAMVSAGAG